MSVSFFSGPCVYRDKVQGKKQKHKSFLFCLFHGCLRRGAEVRKSSILLLPYCITKPMALNKGEPDAFNVTFCTALKRVDPSPTPYLIPAATRFSCNRHKGITLTVARICFLDKYVSKIQRDMLAYSPLEKGMLTITGFICVLHTYYLIISCL